MFCLRWCSLICEGKVPSSEENPLRCHTRCHDCIRVFPLLATEMYEEDRFEPVRRTQTGILSSTRFIRFSKHRCSSIFHISFLCEPFNVVYMYRCVCVGEGESGVVNFGVNLSLTLPPSSLLPSLLSLSWFCRKEMLWLTFWNYETQHKGCRCNLIRQYRINVKVMCTYGVNIHGKKYT